MKKIGIFGGTFNPIHQGHLIVASHIFEEAGLDKLVFMPAGNPPQKMGEEDFAHRLEMIDLAIKDDPRMGSTDIENTEETSYTYNIMDKLRRHCKDDLYFIMGADSIESIGSWYRYEDLLRNNKFIVTTRPGYQVSEETRDLVANLTDHIDYIEGPMVDISSTKIRNRIEEGRSIKYLVPKEVEDYIYDKGLYKTK